VGAAKDESPNLEDTTCGNREFLYPFRIRSTLTRAEESSGASTNPLRKAFAPTKQFAHC